MFLIFSQAVGWHHLEHRDRVQRPAMCCSDREQFHFGLGQSYVQAALACCASREQEPKPKCGLAGPRRALDKIHSMRGQPAVEDFVQPPDADRREGRAFGRWVQ